MSEHISPLDSARFGFTVARVDPVPGSVESLVNELREAGVKLVIGRADSANGELVREMESSGFRLMDVQLRYRHNLKSLPPSSATLNSEVIVRTFLPADADGLVAVARESFEGYGHYAADSRLDTATCRAIYEDWAQKSCVGERAASQIFVAEIHGRTVGYLTFNIRNQNGQRYAAGGMGAVHPDFRSYGIFGELIRHGLQWGQVEDLQWEEHDVIVYNFPVNRAFIGAGFVPVYSFATMHCWLD